MLSKFCLNHLLKGGFLLVIIYLFFCFNFFSGKLLAQNFSVKSIRFNNENRYRGLSVVNDSVAWICGSNGSFGISTNGGKTWKIKNIKGYDSLDFRSVYAWDEFRAVVASAGQPCLILLTEDAGLTWSLVYENKNASAFIDAIDFRDAKNGSALGDPISGHMMLLHTNDGGKSWEAESEKTTPKMFEGESAFAASGTALRYLKNGDLVFVSGGNKARVFIKKKNQIEWKIHNTNFLQGEMGQGIFSFCELNNSSIYLVGGNFKNESNNNNIAFVLNESKMIPPLKTIGGYRECIENINDKNLICVGPSGADISIDNGKTWRELPIEKNFNAIRKARKGKLVLLSGKGKIGILTEN